METENVSGMVLRSTPDTKWSGTRICISYRKPEILKTSGHRLPLCLSLLTQKPEPKKTASKQAEDEPA